MVCGQIHAPATLPKYVLVHLMNKALSRQPTILETWYDYYAMLCYATGGLSLPSHDTLAVWATQSPFLERSLVQSAKRCCLQERLNNGVFCGRMFLLCIPLKYDHIPHLISLLIPVCGTPFPSQNKPSHCVTVARDLSTSTKMD